MSTKNLFEYIEEGDEKKGEKPEKKFDAESLHFRLNGVKAGRPATVDKKLPFGQGRGALRPVHDRVYTILEALYFLRISRPTLIKYVKQGIVRGTKIGCHWQFEGSDLLALMNGETNQERR